MVQLRNAAVGYTVKGISCMGLSMHGKIMVGDRAFGLYNNRNVKNHIQIPWDEMDTIVASALFRGRKISHFAVMTENNGAFSLSFHDSRALLRAVANYIDRERMVCSLSFLGVIKRSIRRIVHKKREDQASC